MTRSAKVGEDVNSFPQDKASTAYREGWPSPGPPPGTPPVASTDGGVQSQYGFCSSPPWTLTAALAPVAENDLGGQVFDERERNRMRVVAPSWNFPYLEASDPRPCREKTLFGGVKTFRGRATWSVFVPAPNNWLFARACDDRRVSPPDHPVDPDLDQVRQVHRRCGQLLSRVRRR